MKNKHLTLEERTTIKIMLEKGESFKAIGRALGKDCTTISKEVRNHFIIKQTGGYGKGFNNCRHRYICDKTNLCNPACFNKYCKYCGRCCFICKDYEKDPCIKLEYPPYVCNSCPHRGGCTLEKHVYHPKKAHDEYRQTLSWAREGACIDENEQKAPDERITPLLKKGQSLHHICQSNMDYIMLSERTLYNYMDKGLFSADSFDMPRKIRYRKRKSKNDSFKVDRKCRQGRTYRDFIEYMEEHPDSAVVQMDTVEGKKGEPVLLTIHFVNAQFMLMSLRNRNDSESVLQVFDYLEKLLGLEDFEKLFPVILTDRGSEFSNPERIEYSSDGHQRTRIFYCDAGSPYQKGAIENNHTLIRRIIPKGSSFSKLTKQNVRTISSHINSYKRKNLGSNCPYDIFEMFYGKKILDKLNVIRIEPNDVTLRPELIK